MKNLKIMKFKKVLCLILSLVIIFSLSACTGNNDELELEYYNKAKSYMDKGDYDKAFEVIDEGLEEVGESAFLSDLLKEIEDAQKDSEEETESVSESINESNNDSEVLRVPDIIGLPTEEAVELLNSLNIDSLICYEENAIFDIDTVIYTDPSVGSVLTPDPEDGSAGSVVLYIALPPTVVEPVITTPQRVTAKNASLVFNERLFPAHTESNMRLTENPYVENGYLVMNFYYDSTSGLNWSQVATVNVENQIVSALISSSDYHVESFDPYYFTISVPVSTLYNQYPYYLEIDFPVSDHNMFIDVTIVW